MDFTEALQACFYKYATFTGRASRPEFWWFVLFALIVLTVADMFGKFLGFVAFAALVMPGLAVGARRLHDIGRSGWLQLLCLVPLVGSIMLLYWFAQPSAGPNDYGNPEVTPYSPTVMPGPGQQ